MQGEDSLSQESTRPTLACFMFSTPHAASKLNQILKCGQVWQE
jgi:hypothetical protein